MKNNSPKSVNALMAYMRKEKHIEITGANQKRKLRNMGYFHGYKGYRFCNAPQNLFPYTNFNELQAVYTFDLKLKAEMYTQIMFTETALKNYALEVLIKIGKSEKFTDIFSKVLNDYKAYPVGSKRYKDAVKKRLTLRNKIYSVIARDYDKNFIVSHYYDKDEPVPIWAIFESLTLGEFGNLLQCMNLQARLEMSHSLGLNRSDDADGKLTEQIVFLLKDLRNAVAHNNVVFDTRFKGHHISNRIKNYISKETGVKNVNFGTIVDYIILITFVMKKCGCSKTEMKQFVAHFSQLYEELRASVPLEIYSKIIHTDTRTKLIKLKCFI